MTAVRLAASGFQLGWGLKLQCKQLSGPLGISQAESVRLTAGVSTQFSEPGAYRSRSLLVRQLRKPVSTFPTVRAGPLTSTAMLLPRGLHDHD